MEKIVSLPVDSLANVGMKVVELGRHVGQCCQAVCVQVFVLLREPTGQISKRLPCRVEIAHSHSGHVELNSSDNYED